MAYCITSQWASSSPQMKLTVVESSSNESTSTLSWTLQYIASSAASTSQTRDWSVSIDGAVVKTGSYSINGKTGTNSVANGTVDIAKTSSSQKISFSCTVAWALNWSGKYQGTSSASGSITVAPRTSYSITYDANGGSGAPSKQTKWYNVDLTLSSTKPTKSGYTFSKWNTESNGTGASYTAGQAYTANTSLYLYAQYTAKTYTVTYNANGGTGGPGRQVKTHGVDLIISDTIPTRTDPYTNTSYTFVGWGVASSSTTVTYAPGGKYTSNADITLYAIWDLPYTAAKIYGVAISRCDSNGTRNEDGTYIRVVASVSASTSLSSVEIRWVLSTDTEWANPGRDITPILDPSSDSAISKVVGNGNIDPDSTYLVRIILTDSAGTRYQTFTLPARSYTIDVLNGGKGIALGRPAVTANLLDVDWNVRIRKDLNVDGTIFDAKGLAIRNGLTAYESAGIDPNTTTEHEILTATNTPNGAFMYIITYFYADKTSTSNRMQMAFPYNKKDGPYYRYYLNGSWSSWLRMGGHFFDTTSGTEKLTGDYFMSTYPVYRRWIYAEVTTTGSLVTIDTLDSFSYLINITGGFIRSSNGTNTPPNFYYSSSNYTTTSVTEAGKVQVRTSAAGTANYFVDYVKY